MKTYTLLEIRNALEKQWNFKKGKIDWLVYEILIDMIYHSDLTAKQRNLASMEALDATTRRGHFDPKNYFTVR